MTDKDIEICREYLRNSNNKIELFSFVSGFIILYTITELIALLWSWDMLKTNKKRIVIYIIFGIIKLGMITAVSYGYNYTIINYELEYSVCTINDVTLTVTEPNFFVWFINITIDKEPVSGNYFTTLTTNNNYPPSLEILTNYTTECWYKIYATFPSEISFSQSVYYQLSFQFLIIFTIATVLNFILSIFYIIYRVKRAPLIIQTDFQENLL